MVEIVLGDAIAAELPLQFGSLASSEADNWMELVDISSTSDIEVKLLVYSNSNLFDGYLEQKLWSTDYFE